MKTTVDISDRLFQEAKRYAGEKGATLREVLEMALRMFLKSRPKKKRVFKLRKHPFGGEGLAEGLNEGEWSTLRERIYEGRGG